MKPKRISVSGRTSMTWSFDVIVRPHREPLATRLHRVVCSELFWDVVAPVLIIVAALVANIWAALQLPSSLPASLALVVTVGGWGLMVRMLNRIEAAVATCMMATTNCIVAIAVASVLSP